jgi:hypothetical protein
VIPAGIAFREVTLMPAAVSEALTTLGVLTQRTTFVPPVFELLDV